jgi:hypothetical protein
MPDRSVTSCTSAVAAWYIEALIVTTRRSGRNPIVLAMIAAVVVTAALAIAGARLLHGRPARTPPRVAWLKSFGDRRTVVRAIASDSTGGVIIAGEGGAHVDFGDGAVTPEDGGAFVAKYARDGKCLWARSGSGDSEAKVLAIGAGDEVFVAGRFMGKARIGADEFESRGQSDIFVAKYRADGAMLWVERFGGADSDDATGIAFDRTSGQVVLAANFGGTTHVGQTTLASAGEIDLLLARLDATGAVRWAKAFGGKGVELAGPLALGPRGEIVVAGEFDGASNLGGASLAAVAGRDIFVAAYAAGGEPLWSRRFGEQGLNRAEALAIASDGAIVLGGSFTERIDFGTGPMAATGRADGYLVKLSKGGDAIWSRHFGGVSTTHLRSSSAAFPSDSTVTAVIAAAKGEVACLGSFSGEGEVQGARVTSDGPMGDIVLVGYSGRGDLRAFTRLGGGGTNGGRAMAQDPSGALLLAGDFDGALAVPGHPLDGVGAFVARFAPR